MSARVEGGDSAAIGWARTVALAVAGATSLALTLDPYLLAGVSTWRVHTGLPLLMLGISGAFVFGLGFRPTNRLVRALLHPAFACALLCAGALLLAQR